MKICEYDDVKCPYCGENKAEKLTEVSRCSIEFPSGRWEPGHAITCQSCGGDFAIACLD